MAVQWRHTLHLADVWKSESLEFEEQRNIVVERIKKLPMYETDYDLQNLADELQDAEEIDEFDAAWDYFYDWADANGVWVATF